jgi:hypothetical protein
MVKVVDKDYYKQREKRVIDAGLCRRCGKPREQEDRTHCNKCLSDKCSREKKRQIENGKKGLCRECAKPCEQKDKSCCNKCLEMYKQIAKRHRKKVKDIAVSHLTNGENRCVNCGLPLYDVLQIDHINGDGAQHRKEIGKGGNVMYSWLIKNGFPDGFQILCSNCNFFKRMNSRLPDRQELAESYKKALLFLEGE